MGTKSFFWSLNKIPLCRLLDNLYTGWEKKKNLRKRGRKTLPYFGATLQTEPWAPMAVFQGRIWELSTAWSSAQAPGWAPSLLFTLESQSAWRAHTYIWKNFHWNGFQRALLEATPAAAGTKQNGLLEQPQKQPMLRDQPHCLSPELGNFWGVDAALQVVSLC